MKSIILLSNFLSVFAALIFGVVLINQVNAYEVDCEGYDSDTDEYVYGTCSNGNFDGYDSDTGEYVYGDCEIGGSLDAYNSDTGEYVYGQCDN